MTVETTVNTTTHLTNGATTVFPFYFLLLDAANLVVRLQNLETSATTIVEAGSYSISGIGGAEGGSITFGSAPVDGQRLIIQRIVPYKQPLDIVNQGGFYPDTLEEQLDLQVMQAQQLATEVDRAIKVPTGEDAPSIASLADADGKVLAVANGQIVPINNDPAFAEDAAARASASASQAASIRAAVAADKMATAADRAAAEQAVEDAGVARDQAIVAGMAQDIYPVAARDDVPRGATGTGAITGGSTGTDGTFALAFTGGNFDVNPMGSFTVSGGAVTAINITGPGLYIGNSPTAPTLDFSASAGLAGAAATLTVDFLVPAGRYYYAPSTDDGYVAQFQNVAGVATLIEEHFDPLSVAIATEAAATVTAALADLIETDTIGRAVTPVNGSSGSVNTRVFANPVERSGSIDKVRAYSSVTGTIKAKVGTRTSGAASGKLVVNDTLTLIDAATLTVSATGANEWDVDIPVEEGQFIGWWFSATGVVDFLADTPSDSGGFWWDNTQTGDNSAMTMTSSTSGAQWQIGFDIEVAVVTKDTDRKATFAYDLATVQVGRKPRPIPAIAADIDWVMCLSADAIDPAREVGTGNRLQEWLDLTGNGNSPATTTSPRPVYDPDAFGVGIPGLQFVGGDDGATGEVRPMYLQETMALTQPFTVVAIVEIPSINTAELRLVEGYTSADAGGRASMGIATGGKPYVGNAPTATIISPDAISAAEPHLLIGTYNGSASSISVDGEVKATGTIEAMLDGLVFGAGRGALAIFNGAVGMLGYVNGTLSTAQIAAIYAYASTRYGVSL